MHAPVLQCINQHTKFEVPSFINSKDMIGAKFKQRVHVTLTTPIRGQSVILRPALDIFYLHTKFGNFCLIHSGDMMAGIEIKNKSCDLEHTPFRGGLSSKN